MAITPEVRSTLLRLVALLAFVVSLDLWVTHHFGFSLVTLVAIGGLAALLPFLASWGDWLLTEKEKGAAKGALRRGGRWIIAFPFLVLLYSVGVVAFATVSSVQVLNEMPDSAVSVALTYPGQPGDTTDQTLERDEVVRFRILTTPLGRPIRLGATGFVPTSFMVYPLTGLTVSLGRDVPVAPTLLFRPERNGLFAMKSRGTFRVSLVSPDGSKRTIAETTAVQSSFFLGPPHAIPPSMLEDWRLELTCAIEADRNWMLLAWKRPTLLTSSASSPGPGTRIRAEVWARNGELVGSNEVALGTDRLIEVPVVDSGPSIGTCR